MNDLTILEAGIVEDAAHYEKTGLKKLRTDRRLLGRSPRNSRQSGIRADSLRLGIGVNTLQLTLST